MTDGQRNPGEERRQPPFDGDSMAARMRSMMLRCADMMSFEEGPGANTPNGAEGEEAAPTEPPCRCR